MFGLPENTCDRNSQNNGVPGRRAQCKITPGRKREAGTVVLKRIGCLGPGRSGAGEFKVTMAVK
jgi:hypothetical protein